MNRQVVVAICLIGSPALGQAPDRTIRLTISPAAPPVPALKYQLLPELKDQTPGNAALSYYRAFSPDWMSHRLDKEFYQKLERWQQTPLKDLSRAELEWLSTYHPLRELDHGAGREECDWQMTARVRADGFMTLLPDLNGFRSLVNLLALRARLEASEGKFDQALRTLRTGFALAKHLQEYPAAIAGLVGAAIAQQMLRELEQLIQQPNAPNLYWALTELPSPFLDSRKAVQGERLMTSGLVPDVSALENTVLTPSRAQELLQRLARDLHLLGAMARDGAGESDAMAQLGLVVLIVKSYPRARQYLREHGKPADVVEAMPAPQVVMLYSLYQFRRLQDDLSKWSAVPYWQARAGLRLVDDEVRKATRRGDGGLPLSLVVPATEGLLRSVANTDRRIAALRCIEAMRMYAAGHEGRLPQKLSDISGVPIPIDALTGKEFEYEVKDGRAILAASALEGEPSVSLRYELTVKR